MRTVATLAVVLLFAGCLSAAPTPEPSPTAGAGAVQEELVFRACLEETGTIPIERSVAEGFLPEGFTAPGHTNEPSGETAELYTIFFDCPVIVDGVDRPSAFVMLALVVEPPAELRDPATPLSMMPLLSYSNDADVVRVLNTWGLGPAHVADVSVELPFSTQNTRRGVAEADGPEGGIRFETVAGGDTEAVPGPPAKLRMFGVDGEPLKGTPGTVHTAVDLWYPAGNVFQGVGQWSATGNLAQALSVPAPAAVAVHWWGSTYDIHLERNETVFQK